MAQKLSETIAGELIPTTDIGGTGVGSGYYDAGLFDRIIGICEIGPSTYTDDTLLVTLQQATEDDDGGSDVKTLVQHAVSDHTVGNTITVEARSSDLDIANGFRWVRLYISEAANDGVNNVHGGIVLADARYPAANLIAATEAT